MWLSYLEDGRHLSRLHPCRRRRRRAYAPTSNTASHDNHEKINSWVSFSFLYGYGAPLGGSSRRRSSAIKVSLSSVVGLLSMWYWHFCQVRQNDETKWLNLQTAAWLNEINPLLLHIIGCSLLNFMSQGPQVTPSLITMVYHFPLKIKIMA